MGKARRKVQNIEVPERPLQIPATCSRNFIVNTGNPRKSNLGGVIFGCKHGTKDECLRNLGLTSFHCPYVKQGLPLFLLNHSDRKLYGIYEAASHGQMNVDSRALPEDDTEATKFPAQGYSHTTHIAVIFLGEWLTINDGRLTTVTNPDSLDRGLSINNDDADKNMLVLGGRFNVLYSGRVDFCHKIIVDLENIIVHLALLGSDILDLQPVGDLVAAKYEGVLLMESLLVLDSKNKTEGGCLMISPCRARGMIAELCTTADPVAIGSGSDAALWMFGELVQKYPTSVDGMIDYLKEAIGFAASKDPGTGGVMKCHRSDGRGWSTVRV